MRRVPLAAFRSPLGSTTPPRRRGDAFAAADRSSSSARPKAHLTARRMEAKRDGRIHAARERHRRLADASKQDVALGASSAKAYNMLPTSPAVRPAAVAADRAGGRASTAGHAGGGGGGGGGSRRGQNAGRATAKSKGQPGATERTTQGKKHFLRRDSSRMVPVRNPRPNTTDVESTVGKLMVRHSNLSAH